MPSFSFNKSKAMDLEFGLMLHKYPSYSDLKKIRIDLSSIDGSRYKKKTHLDRVLNPDLMIVVGCLGSLMCFVHYLSERCIFFHSRICFFIFFLLDVFVLLFFFSLILILSWRIDSKLSRARFCTRFIAFTFKI